MTAARVSTINKLRIGLVGCGQFGESHLATIAGIPYAEVVAVADVNSERAAEIASRYHIRNVTTDFRELCTLKEVDAVHVVTSEDQHVEPVLAAFENRKHVFVEKPMATKVEDAEKMIRAARKAGLIFMPGHVCRFESKYAAVKEQLSRQRLGRIISMTARQNRPKGMASAYKRTHQLLVCSVHEIDIMLWYTGATVRRVRGYQVDLQKGGGADLSWGILEFEGGALGFVQTMWLLPDKLRLLDDGMQVITDSGVANINIHSGLDLWLEDGPEIPDISYELRVRGSVFGALREELSYFALCVLRGVQPTVVTAEDGVESVRVACALVESATNNREVQIHSVGTS